ncbi:MAG: tyrosine protein kinase [Bacteroidia bacterium]|nr:MAG: tyrosine protein kinase [Bacteroidia bacterium]
MRVQQEWDFRRILIVLSRQWWWPALSLVFAAFTAWAYLRYTEATYQTTAVVQVNLTQMVGGFQAQNAGQGFFPMEMLTDAYLELWSRYDLIAQVVEQLKLNYEVYSVGKVGRSLVFPHPFEMTFSSPRAETLFWQAGKVRVIFQAENKVEVWRGEDKVASGKVGQWMTLPGALSAHVKIDCEPTCPSEGVYEVALFSPQAAAFAWQRRVSVIPKRGLTILQVGVTDISPVRAARFLTTLIERAREHERNIRQVQYTKALSYIDTLISFFQNQLLIAQDTLYKVEIKGDVLFMEARKGRALSLYQDVEKIDKNLLLKNLNVISERLQSVVDTLRKDPGAEVGPLPGGTLPELQGPLADLNQLLEQRLRLLKIYQPRSPILLTHNQLVLSRLMALLQLVEQRKQELLYELSALRQNFLQGRAQLYRDVLSERQIALLQEDIELRREVYKSLLEKKMQIAIEREAVLSAIQVTQPPLVPSTPLYPNPLQVYVLFLVGGGIIGVGGVLVRHLVEQKVSYRVDLEQIAPVPILGELPYQRPKSQAGFSLAPLQLEVLRALRGALGFVWESEKPRLLLVTSTVSGEGKTFVARSLAYVHALAGYRVLLIDADLRRASLSQGVGVRERGLSLILARLVDIERYEELLVPLEQSGLFLLPAGPSAPNPPELLETPAFSHLIAEASRTFDYIVIDTAPVGIVPDTLAILHHLENAVTLYVFRADYSRIPFLSHLADIVEKHHLKKVYLLFNGTRLSRPRYGYGYGYGYYGESYARKYYRSGSTSFWERVREWIPV